MSVETMTLETMTLSVETEQTRRLLSCIGRTLPDDAAGPAPEEEPAAAMGLFMDICISMCTDELTDAREYSAERLKACRDSGYSCNSDCTAETESSSSTGASSMDSVTYSMVNVPLCSSEVYSEEIKETPPAPSSSPRKMSIAYRDQSFNSELSIIESTTLDATEPTAPKQPRGASTTGKPNGSSSESCRAKRSAAPIDAANKGPTLYKDSQTGKSYLVRPSTANVESPSNEIWREYIDFETGRSYFANGNKTTWYRPSGVTVEPAPSPRATCRETGGKRVSGSTLRRLFSTKRPGSPTSM